MKNDITIVIPAYRAEKTIGRAIASLKAQLDTSFKLIIVCDGPDPQQFMAVQTAISGRDIGKACTVLQLPLNVGPGAARNEALTHIRGGYVMFLDADDVLCPDAVMFIRNAAETEPAPDMIDGGFLLYEVLKLLTDEEKGKFLMACFEYSFAKIKPKFSGMLLMAWTITQPKLDYGEEAHHKKILDGAYAAYVRECKKNDEIPAGRDVWISENIGRYPPISADINIEPYIEPYHDIDNEIENEY